MNAHEKSILHLSVQDIAIMATEKIQQRIDAELPGEKQYFSPGRVNDIIRDVLNEFVPKETVRKMGILVHFSIGGAASSYKAIGESCILSVNLRKNHPFYCDLLKHDRQCTTWTLFTVKRKYFHARGTRVLVFEKLIVSTNDFKGMTIAAASDRLAGWTLNNRESLREAAKVCLRLHEDLGAERVKELKSALQTLSHAPLDSLYGLRWDKEEDLLNIGGLSHRTQAILEATAAGRHIMPAGVEHAKMLPETPAPVATELSAEAECEEATTKTLNVTVFCSACYNSSIQIPKEMSLEEGIAYAREHIKDIPLGTLEYISDSDELDEENCDIEGET